MAAAVEVIRGAARAAALLDPVRLRMLEHLAEPDSAAGVARLMKLPRQRVTYHLRELEREGLVELVEERRKGNCLERVVRATARHYLISPEALGPLGANQPSITPDRFSTAYLIGVAARAIREVAILRLRADRAKQRLATFTIETGVRFATAQHRAAFAEELAEAFAGLAAKYHDAETPGGRMYRFFAGGYPAITKTEPDGDESARLD